MPRLTLKIAAIAISFSTLAPAAALAQFFPGAPTTMFPSTVTPQQPFSPGPIPMTPPLNAQITPIQPVQPIQPSYNMPPLPYYMPTPSFNSPYTYR